MPRLSGLGVIHRQRQNPKLETVSIVIVTRQDPEKYRTSAIAESCDDFLIKPIDFDQWDALLDYYTPTGKRNRHRSQRTARRRKAAAAALALISLSTARMRLFTPA